METLIINQYQSEFITTHYTQSRWQRIALLIILGYEGLGCLLGGILLIAGPDGHLLKMPVELMKGVFKSFLIPGIILLSMGILTSTAFLSVSIKRSGSWILSGLSMGGLLIWFIIEIFIIQELHWLHAMWGIPVVAGFLLTLSLVPSTETVRKVLLIGGIISSFLYVLINIIVPLQWADYNPVTQTISELSAIGAPTSLLWTMFCIPYTVLVVAFGWGVLRSGVRNRPLHITGLLLIIYGGLGIFWPFAPMHLRETLAAGGGTLSDILHIILATITQVIYLTALVIAAVGLGKSFRIYSLITFVVLMVFGVLTFMEAPGISTNEPTPFIGVWERINIGVFLIWIIVLAGVLLKRNIETDPAHSSKLNE